jgi:multidrug efflux pump subunit AcrA (membrane-fusion protein)
MSSPIIDSSVQVSEPKVKKPTLIGKYTKLSVFGYWFAQNNDVSDEVRAQLLASLHVFDTVETQTAYFDAFVEAEKDTAKAMRKAVVAHNKPVKAPAKAVSRKTKALIQQDTLIAQLISDATSPSEVNVVDKEAEKQAKLAEKEAEKQAKEADKQAKEADKQAKEADKQAKLAEKEAEKQAKLAEKEAEKQAKLAEKEAEKQAKLAEKQPKSTKPKDKKQQKVQANNIELTKEPLPEEVTQQVTEQVTEPAPVLAQISDNIVEVASIAQVNEATEEVPAPVTSKKTTTKKEKTVTEPSQKEKKEKKEKKDKKTKIQPQPQPEEEEEEEVQTRVVIISDKEYLLDGDFNVYNTEFPHHHIGVYNQETNLIESV